MSGYEGRTHKVIGVLDCARGQEYVTVKALLWPDEVAIVQDIIHALDSGRGGEGPALLTMGDCGARTVADVEVRTQ